MADVSISGYPAPKGKLWGAPYAIRSWSNEVARASGTWTVTTSISSTGIELVEPWLAIGWDPDRYDELKTITKRFPEIRRKGPYRAYGTLYFYEFQIREPGGEFKTWAEFMPGEHDPDSWEEGRDSGLSVIVFSSPQDPTSDTFLGRPTSSTLGRTQPRALSARQRRHKPNAAKPPRRRNWIAIAAGGIVIVTVAAALVPALIKLSISSMRG